MQNNALSGNPSGFGLFVQGALGDGIQGGGWHKYTALGS